METKDILLELRKKQGLSQSELAEKVFTTRQAVSRWETGETIPSTDTLKLLSSLYNVPVDVLLGKERTICQCCGMPLDDSTVSHEPDGQENPHYCKWCYTDGRYVYTNLEELVEFLSTHFNDGTMSQEQLRQYFEAELPKLDHWKV